MKSPTKIKLYVNDTLYLKDTNTSEIGKIS